MVKMATLNKSLKDGSYIGFDFGTKKIGVAIGDASLAIASPLKTIPSINQNPNWETIAKLISQWQPVGLVVGISRQSDGTDNVITPRMHKFCRQLNGRFQLPVYPIDESLTTFAAKQLLFDDLQVSAGKLWAVQDQVAAQLILQSWFNVTF